MNLATELGSGELRLAQRIKQAVEEAGGGTSVSVRSGIPLSTLRKYMSGAISPAAVVVERIAQATERAVASFFGDDPAVSGTLVPDSAISSLPGLVYVPILDVLASAGTGLINDSEAVVAHLPFPFEFLRVLGVNPEKVQAIRGARGTACFRPFRMIAWC